MLMIMLVYGVVTNHYILIFFCICKIIINNCLYVHFAFITVASETTKTDENAKIQTIYIEFGRTADHG